VRDAITVYVWIVEQYEQGKEVMVHGSVLTGALGWR
jgi:hypothetical protein